MKVAPMNEESTSPESKTKSTCQSTDWYAEGESRVVDIDGVQVRIRYLGRKGRRGRIVITAPAGAVFDSK
jgi:hypothetical protein